MFVFSIMARFLVCKYIPYASFIESIKALDKKNKIQTE